MLHSPLASHRDEDPQEPQQRAAARPMGEPLLTLDAPTSGNHPGCGESVDAVQSCRLPPFWKSNPELWFLQVEAVFQALRVRNDETKYSLAVSLLDPKSLQELSDIIRLPPPDRKYELLKATILSRFSDSADRQLLRLLTQLELGDRKPSQLLRQMRTLAGTRVPEDVIRVRWLDLLPISIQQILKVLKTHNLEELAAAADELLGSGQGYPVAAVQPPASTCAVCAASGGQLTSRQPDLAAVLTDIRASLLRMEASQRDILSFLRRQPPVDSGSVISLLPRSQTRDKLPTQRLTLLAANASPIATYGMRTLVLNLALRRDFEWRFIVADVQTAILGADFLAHFGLLVDVAGRRLLDSLTSLQVQGVMCRASVHSIAVRQEANVPEGQLGVCYTRVLADFASGAKDNRASSGPSSTGVRHHILTTGPPCFERPRRLSGERLAAAKAEFDSLRAQNIVRPSSSQWASPIHLVKKKTGGWRATGDYRRLNASTVPDWYPLPNIEDLLQDCHGCTVFSVVDLERAYYQLPVAEEDVPKTAVTTPFDLFEFVGMPLGLRNASQTFQRHMDLVLRNLRFVRCYLNDLLVLSKSHEQHIEHLQLLFAALSQAQLSINLDKCMFGRNQVTYLGFLVSQQGYQPPPQHVQAIRDFPLPKTVADLRRFLGMLNFYRRCIPKAAELQAPLHNFLKGAKKRDRSEVHTAIGAALKQFEDGSWRPTGFFSRKLSDAEQRYSTYDRELLAIFASIKYFQRILEGRQFRLTLEHVKGQDNVVADTLSRACAIDMPTILDAATIANAQDDDDELPHLRDNAATPLQRLTIKGYDVYCSIAGIRVRPYLPVSLRRRAFDVVHGLAHPSGRASVKATQRFFWPGIKKDVARWARECQPCQRAKVHRHNHSALGRFNTPDNRFDHVHVDIVKLPLVAGRQYCLIAIDRFSRWPIAVPLQDMQAGTIAAAFFEHWICHYGTPLTITSDQGAQFESALFTALAQLIGAKRIRTAPYHPQSNGIIQRFHRSLKAALMCNPQTPWMDLLPAVILGLRTCFKQDLQASAAEMLYGTALRIPGEFFVTQNQPACPQVFLSKFRSLIRDIKPTEFIRKPLEPPYTGPHEGSVLKALVMSSDTANNNPPSLSTSTLARSRRRWIASSVDLPGLDPYW
ncbi:uncharacterized protein LOC112589349 [Harpegnathos saltator]|uniref:uncharacterized protein LOC112589349 n=1 Tax=Harpegnathos saltator TaxID=610380 RepID=UPI000DBEDC08|nr:uncharacterized protein LOC112589349 [Harpegnathos saltator]